MPDDKVPLLSIVDSLATDHPRWWRELAWPDRRISMRLRFAINGKDRPNGS